MDALPNPKRRHRIWLKTFWGTLGLTRTVSVEENGYGRLCLGDVSFRSEFRASEASCVNDTR